MTQPHEYRDVAKALLAFAYGKMSENEIQTCEYIAESEDEEIEAMIDYHEIDDEEESALAKSRLKTFRSLHTEFYAQIIDHANK